MATATTNIHTETPGIFAKVGSFFGTIGHALVKVGEANSRFQEVERLNRMSDEQLAELGVKRDEIPRHVFRDLFYV